VDLVGAGNRQRLLRRLRKALEEPARAYAAEGARLAVVDINLEQAEKSTSLTVTADGIGISDSQANGAASFGLLGIRERISALGGKVDIQGIPGEGTSIQIVIPRGRD